MLAIETSQHEASVALRTVSGETLDESLLPKKRHDDDLLPAIDRMFTRAGMRATDLRGGVVAVSIGPGGFTGLRIAVSTAKMLAETLHVKLIAVPSALAAAEEHHGDGPIIVALASKNETFWCTRLERAAVSDQRSAISRENSRVATRPWVITNAPGIVQATAFDLSGLRTVIADEFFPDAARERAMSANVPIITPRFEARLCLMVGARMLERGEIVDPLHLLPLYPREPEAVTLWQRREEKK